MTPQFPVLIGDIGGTNARFAAVAGPGQELKRFEPVRISAFASIADAIRKIAGDMGAPPRTMVLAIATPLVGDRFRLTNGDWVIDPRELIGAFGLSEIVLMNDFAAQALAVLALDPSHLKAAGGPNPVPEAPKVVIGPGTGLGIAFLAKVGDFWTILPGEGGHIDLGPRTERESAIWPQLDKEKSRMSAEYALSGRGLENLYRAICRTDRVTPAAGDASTISELAGKGANAQADEAVALFVRLLARVAGDMALLVLARGGVYVGGGIGARFADRIATSEFRGEFENKAPHEGILRTVPVFVLTHPTGALDGLAAFIRRPKDFSLEMATRRFSA